MHALLPSDLDKSALRATVVPARDTADSYDDEIKKRWGVQRVADP